METKLCPSCINEFQGELGDESLHRIELGVEFKLCNEHKWDDLEIQSELADQKLGAHHEHITLRMFRRH